MDIPELVPPVAWLDVVVAGDPIPQPRARAGVRNGKVHFYHPTNDPVLHYRQHVAVACKMGLPAGTFPTTRAVAVCLVFVIRPPQDLDGKIRTLTPVPKLPDVDNYTKACLDALKNVVWKDDGCVAFLSARKFYAMPGLPPATHVQIGWAL